MNYATLPNIDDNDLEEQMEAILIADAKTCREIGSLLEGMSWPQKMAIGLHAYWLLDQTHTQLYRLTPKHGELPTNIVTAIQLLQKLSPQSLVEVSSEILLEDWELEAWPEADDAPSITIE